MKTTVVLHITHDKPIPELADMAAGRIYTLQGVDDCEVVSSEITALRVMVMPEPLIQDSSPTKDGKRLSQWFASKLDARRRAREAV